MECWKGKDGCGEPGDWGIGVLGEWDIGKSDPAWMHGCMGWRASDRSSKLFPTDSMNY